jgi:CRISPR-associated protein Cmr6
MTFASAFKKAKQSSKSKKNGLDFDIPDGVVEEKLDPEQVPLMYRAQINGRCSLQYAKYNNHLDRWTYEWVNPSKSDGQPKYQREEPEIGLQGTIYRIRVRYLWRVFSNCGQDSIFRPMLGKDGIPFIPGSSVKGLFERLSRSEQISVGLREKVREYCGSLDRPGTLRFHGAYPIGDWAGTKTVDVWKDGASTSEIRYRVIDVVHPQQRRQVQGLGTPKAIALVSFYQPTLIFEISSTKRLTDEEWKTIGGLLKRALRQGLGGKTSSGYGLWAIPKDKYSLSVELKGYGVSPLLRNDEPEFRPNLFKATLRSHASRLLAGVSADPRVVEQKIQYLFGHTTNPGCLQLFWESKKFDEDTQGTEKTPTFQTEGTLYLDAPNEKDVAFLQTVLEFTYFMGGFGKSWRRVWHNGSQLWHPGFYSSYKTRAIGCHWKWQYPSFEPSAVFDSNTMKAFFEKLQKSCQQYTESNHCQSLDWKEAWNPSRVVVYTGVATIHSKAVELFHDASFKTTPAIGGRNLHDKRPTSISSVWHRMLPINESQYLEIVTVFYGGCNQEQWLREGEDQLPVFLDRLANNGFQRCWGEDPLVFSD